MKNTASDMAMDLWDRMNHHIGAIEYIADKTKDEDLSANLCAISETMEKTKTMIKPIISIERPDFRE